MFIPRLKSHPIERLSEILSLCFSTKHLSTINAICYHMPATFRTFVDIAFVKDHEFLGNRFISQGSQFIGRTKMENVNLISEQESAVVDNDTCASSLPTSTVKRTIGKTTYIANLHFKDQGQTFAQKLKMVLISEGS